MRFGIPLLEDRVAPRCTFADSVLLVTAKRRRIEDQAVVPLEGNTWADLASVLAEHEVETLVCGGISRSTRESISARDVAIIDNVAGTSEEVLEAVRKDRIHPGFGLGADRSGQAAADPGLGRSVGESRAREAGANQPADRPAADGVTVNCLTCQNRVCLGGEPCPHVLLPSVQAYSDETRAILEAAWDVASESERTLCRLAEVVYFALERRCTRVGVGFCVDLQEPAAILTGVLERFFEVVPVCCRVGGNALPEGETGCDPSALAAVLNAAHTELNVLVGLCVGADCVFNRESKAPATTLFVKDKSLANNPIGAVYSHYYLKDI